MSLYWNIQNYQMSKRIQFTTERKYNLDKLINTVSRLLISEY